MGLLGGLTKFLVDGDDADDGGDDDGDDDGGDGDDDDGDIIIPMIVI